MSQWIEVEHMPDEFEGIIWVATPSSVEPVLCETWMGDSSRKRRFTKYEFDNYNSIFINDVTHCHDLIVPRPLGK